MRKLEELFDLPTAADDEVVEPTPVLEITQEAMSNLNKIDAALPAVRGLDASDVEMDALAEMAVNSYKDLFDLGMNVEARVATEILSSASQFLGHAITAKTAKINKKIKMIELQLKKAKLDQDKGQGEEGVGQMLDRNELLAQILEQSAVQNKIS
jgi:hypothetical protein